MTWERAVLVILDGFGCAPAGPGNAIQLAATPTIDHLLERWPHTLLEASGKAVGLPAGQQGNSEVGHLTIGSGRVVLQDLTRITAAIEDRSFFANPVLLEAMATVLSRGSNLHIMGLISPGGVHSHQDHLVAVCEMARGQGIASVKVHAFTDGRDTPPESGAAFLESLERDLSRVGVGEIASVSGRYYAMDRDKRWDRLERAYRALTGHAERTAPNAVEYVRQCYAEGTTDEFIEPAAIGAAGAELGGIGAGDVVVHCNFRPDRARELCHALVDGDFPHFNRDPLPENLDLVTFTNFDDTLDVPIAFPKPLVRNTLGDAVSALGLGQFHLAETEKYAHVTYFVNGGREEALVGEERLLVPSSKVATYDLQPEMSAPAITAALVDHIQSRTASLVVVNYANADMVGHTGNLPATIRAVECLDRCLAQVVPAAQASGYVVVITADHGNAEQMLADDGVAPMTSHTTNQVPLIVTDGEAHLRSGGGLRDVAPTVLKLMGIPQPGEMTGAALLSDA